MSDILNTDAPAWEVQKTSGFNDWVGKLDPRLRVVFAAAFSITVVSLHSLSVLVVALAFAIFFMLGAKLPVATTLKRMAAMDGFVIVMLIMLPFTITGEPLFHLFGYPASYEGFMRAIEIGLKANATVLAVLALVGSMESVTFGHALHRLKVPATMVHLLLFTVRYIEVLNEEYQRLRNAMKTRGFRAGNNLHSYKSFGYLVGMMLVRALERSERVLKAMKCRGFAGYMPLLHDFKFAKQDFIAAKLGGLLLLGLVALEVFNVFPY